VGVVTRSYPHIEYVWKAFRCKEHIKLQSAFRSFQTSPVLPIFAGYIQDLAVKSNPALTAKKLLTKKQIYCLLYGTRAPEEF
jgi:hypothetical protein